MTEYKTLVFEDSASGRGEMGRQLDLYSKAGWKIKSKETTQQGWDFGKTCCLASLFLPLALLGKKSNVITVILERNSSKANKKLDEEIEAEIDADEEESESVRVTKIIVITIIGIIFFWILFKIGTSNSY